MHKDFQSMLAHIDGGFTLDLTQEEYPRDVLKGHYNGHSMEIRRRTERSSTPCSTRPLYTLLHVLIEDCVVDTWGLVNTEEENALMVWWGEKRNHLSDSQSDRRATFKAMYRMV